MWCSDDIFRRPDITFHSKEHEWWDLEDFQDKSQISQLQKYLKIEHEVFRGRSVQRPKRAQMISFYFCDWKGHKEKDGGKHSLNLAESSTFTSIWTLFTFWGDMSNKKPFSELFSKNNLEIYDKSVTISFICWIFCVAQRSFVHNGNGFLVNIWISK